MGDEFVSGNYLLGGSVIGVLYVYIKRDRGNIMNIIDMGHEKIKTIPYASISNDEYV